MKKAILTLSFSLFFPLFLWGQTQTEQQQALQELSERYQIEWNANRADAEMRANSENIPVQILQPNGTLLELQRYERGIPLYYRTENITAAKTISTDKVWSGGGLGFDLSGEGIALGEWDGGAIRTTHIELAGRAIQADATTTLNWHSTHVAGTMIAAGINAKAKGMAYKARLYAHDWNSDDAEMAQQAAAGLQVSNHSYGTVTGWYRNYFGDGRWVWFGDPKMNSTEDYKFGYYNADARAWDQIAYNAPNYLIVKSAGNDRGEGPSSQTSHWERSGSTWVTSSAKRDIDGGSLGYDCISTAGNAKNILTVGATEDIPNGYTNPTDVVITSFSGRGPTDDGRIKPDIVGNGRSLYSCTSTSNTAYTSTSGTSMSTPSITGSIGLLLDMQKQLTGSPVMRASTMKALIIHTADEAGNSPGPDYTYGWGLMNTAKAARLMERNANAVGVNIIAEEVLQNNGEIKLTVHSPGRGPLRVTICWTDPAASVPSAQVDPATILLVNDLDLTVESPDATISSPWVLDPARPAASATRGNNFRDNVEQVLIETPVEGDYIVHITHKNSLSGGSQSVSIIASVSDEPSLFSPPAGLANVSRTPSLQWNPMNGADSYNVQLSATADFKAPIVDATGVTETYYIPPILEKNTPYYWRVQLVSSQGNSDWSEIRSFVVGGEAGIAGHALYFDGVDDYASLPHASGFAEIESNDVCTVEAWINIASWYNGYFSIIDKYNPSTDFGWLLQINNSNGINFSSASGMDIPFSPDLDTWYHIAVSYDRGEGMIRAYVNGVLLGESAFDGDIMDTGNGPLYIGYNPSGGDEYANGIIDELRIWKTARTAQEIQDNMNLRLTGSETGLVSVYHLNEGIAFETSDDAGSLTGTLSHGPVWMISQAPLELPGKPELLSPAPNSSGIALETSYSWTSVTGTETYRIQVSDNNSFSNVLYDVNDITRTSVDGIELHPETSYYWRVRGSNLLGNGDWSDVGSFRTAKAPPEAPVLLNPKNDAINQPVSVSLLWTQAARASSYLVQASTDSLFQEGTSSFIVNEPSFPTTMITADNLGNATTYYWRAAGKNAGGTGPWSLTWKFSTVPAIPDAPVLQTPTNDTHGVSASVQFTWKTVEGASTYTFQLATDTTFANPVVNQANLMSPSYHGNGLAEGTEYYWRAQAGNSAGMSDWSETWHFYTVRPAPDAPVLLTPANNTTDVALQATLTWEASQYAETYTVEVASDQQFTQILYTSANLTGTSATTNTLPANAVVYWRVQAENEIGQSIWSDVWSFTTVQPPLEQAVLISPANAETQVAETPAFLWHSIDNADSYSIQVSLSQDFSSVDFEATSLIDTTHSGFALEQMTTYYWHVRGVSSIETGDWSETWSFTTVLPLPGAVTLISPIHYDSVFANSTVDFTFTWEKAEPMVTTYWLQHSGSYADSVSLYDPVDGINDSTITDTTYQMDVYSGGASWWRVRAKNASGWGPWSDVAGYLPRYTGIDRTPAAQDGYILSASYPNPATMHGTCTIEYTIPRASDIAISVVDITGKMVQEVLSRHTGAGTYTTELQPTALRPGTYFIVLQSGSVRLIRNMIVIR